MISIRAFENAQTYARYLAKEGIGQWMGSGSEALGLEGEVTETEYQRLCRGEHPVTRDYLRPIRQAERLDIKRTERLRELGRIDSETEIKFIPRQAYSVVLSSPKTVGIQGLLDDRLLGCHETATADIVKQIESFSGSLVIAAYQHRLTRTADPLIHTHLVVMNLRLKDDGWKSLDAWWLYANKAALTEQFERTVLKEAERLGYQVEYPHLSGIPDEVFNKFCQRSGEREDAIRQYKQERNIPEDLDLSARQIATIVYTNRGEKQHIPQQQIRAQQIARLTPEEQSHLHQMKEKAYERSYKLNLYLDVAQGEESGESPQLTYGERIRL